MPKKPMYDMPLFVRWLMIDGYGDRYVTDDPRQPYYNAGDGTWLTDEDYRVEKVSRDDPRYKEFTKWPAMYPIVQNHSETMAVIEKALIDVLDHEFHIDNTMEAAYYINEALKDYYK